MQFTSSDSKGWVIMKRFISLAATAVAVLAPFTAAAQPSHVLNALEVRMLVASAAPADNAKLAAHFSALTDRYTAEARRHTSMSGSFTGNPNRSIGSGMSMHCKRLADLNTESAATVRGLAEHHAKLASGLPSTPPPDSAKYQGGEGASVPSDKELNALAAKARTPSEHHALEEYFMTLAKRYTATADEQVALAAAYRGTKMAQAATAADRLVTLSRDSAKEANEAASMHKQLAALGR